MREILRSDFPGFRVVDLTYRNSDPGLFAIDGVRLAYYQFRMESEDVPGFTLYGVHNLVDSNGSHDWEPPETMFDRKTFSATELIELQSLWVRKYPGVPIAVSDETSDGPVSSEQLAYGDLAVTPQYSDIPLGQVWRLNGDRNDRLGSHIRDYFFRFDPRTRHWTHLPGFVAPGWE